jgi:hypothetical protein
MLLTRLEVLGGRLLEFYYEHVTFQTETALFGFLTLPIALTGLQMISYDKLSFSSLEVSLAYQSLVVVCGTVGVEFLKIINMRHARARIISGIIGQRASPKQIFEVQDHKGISRALFVLGIIQSNQRMAV